MDREWMRDIRICDGCKTEQYTHPRYDGRKDNVAGYAGVYCDRCWGHSGQGPRGLALKEHANG